MAQTLSQESVRKRIPHLYIDCQSLLALKDVSHNGWLRKQKSVLKTWAMKYIVLHKGCVYIFQTEKALKATNSYSLYGFISVEPATEIRERDIPWVFKLVHEHNDRYKPKYFAASSEREFNVWMQHFDDEIKIANQDEIQTLCDEEIERAHEAESFDDDIGNENESFEYAYARTNTGPFSRFKCQSEAVLCSIQGKHPDCGGFFKKTNSYQDVHRPLPATPQFPTLQRRLSTDSYSSYISMHEEESGHPNSDQKKQPTGELENTFQGINLMDMENDETNLPPPVPPRKSQDYANISSVTSNKDDDKEIKVMENQPTTVSSAVEDDYATFDEDFPVFDIPCSVIAMTTYIAKNRDELSFQMEDKFELVEECSNAWWVGKRNGQKGFFPASCVKKIDLKKTVSLKDASQRQAPPIPPRRNKSEEYANLYSAVDDAPTSEKGVKDNDKRRSTFYLSKDEDYGMIYHEAFSTCTNPCSVIALAGYTACSDDELTFDKDDKFEFIEEVTDAWWVGKIRNKKGLFPANRVKKVYFTTTSSSDNASRAMVSPTLHAGQRLETKSLEVSSNENNKRKGSGKCGKDLEDEIYNRIILESTASDEPRKNRVKDDTSNILKEENKETDPVVDKSYNTDGETRKKVLVVVVGPKNSGKTSLINRLMGLPMRNEGKANGVEIHSLICKSGLKGGKWIKENEDVFNVKIDNEVQEPTPFDATENTNYQTKNLQSEVSSTDDDDESDDENDTWEPTYQNLPIHGHVTEMADEFSSDWSGTIPQTSDDDTKVSIEIRDLAGDEDFYNTHPIFMTNEAVYIIAFKLSDFGDPISIEKSRSELSFWLKTICCYRKNSISFDNLVERSPKILIVGTYKDIYQDNVETFKEMLESEVQEAAKGQNIKQHIRKYVFVSNVKDKDEVFDALRTEILFAAKEAKHWNERLPLHWIQLEKAILKHVSLKQFSINKRNIINLAAEVIVPKMESKVLESFLDYHHLIGTFIYLDSLTECVVIFPQWLADALNCIITADDCQAFADRSSWAQFRQTGRLTNELVNILFNSHNTEQKASILEFMKKSYLILHPRILEKGQKIIQELDFIVPCIVHAKNFSEINEIFNCPSKSSWLCIKFDFLPPHILASVFVMYGQDMAIVRGPRNTRDKEYLLNKDYGLFYLDIKDKEVLLLKACSDVLLLQVWRWSEVNHSYSLLREGLLSKLEQLSKLYHINLSYKVFLKCGSTDYDRSDNMVAFDDVKNGKAYFCAEHNELHDTKEMKMEWLGTDKLG